MMRYLTRLRQQQILRPVVIITRDQVEGLDECLRGEEIVHPRAEYEFIIQSTEYRQLCVIKLP